MKRRLPMILVAGIAVLCVAGAVAAGVAGGVGFSPVAYRVNGTEVSQSTVDHDLKALADPDAASRVQKIFGAAASTTTGAVTSSFSATWLDLQIRNELYRQGAEQAKTVVTDQDREAQRPVIDQLLANSKVGFTLAKLPEPLQRGLLDNYAYPVALGLDTQAKISAFLAAALRKAEISVDPRYGFWNPRQGVCAPTGCASSTTPSGG
jgi:hypothetical protein